jgi:hypothetical protein
MTPRRHESANAFEVQHRQVRQARFAAEAMPEPNEELAQIAPISIQRMV